MVIKSLLTGLVLFGAMLTGYNSSSTNVDYASNVEKNNRGNNYSFTMDKDPINNQNYNAMYWYGTSGMMDILNNPGDDKDSIMTRLNKNMNKTYVSYVNQATSVLSLNKGYTKIADRDFDVSPISSPSQYFINSDAAYTLKALFTNSAYNSSSDLTKVEVSQVWPLSRGISDWKNPDGSDYFNTFLMDKTANSSRGDLFFGDEESFDDSLSDVELEVTQTGYTASESSKYWKIWKQETPEGVFRAFEPADRDKVVIAHACFYMATKFYKPASVTDPNRVGLKLVDIYQQFDPSSAVEGIFGDVNALRRWSDLNNPLKDWEMVRNNVVYENIHAVRNIYIDFPDRLVDALFSDELDLSGFNFVQFTDDATDSNLQVLVGDTITLTTLFYSDEHSYVDYASSNEAIAVINSFSIDPQESKTVSIRGIAVGSVQISASIHDNPQIDPDRITIHVISAPIEASNYSISIPSTFETEYTKANLSKITDINDAQNLVANINPNDLHKISYVLSAEASEDNKAISYSSSNISVAYIYNNYFVCMSLGSATITAYLTDYPYIKASVLINVDYANGGDGNITFSNS